MKTIIIVAFLVAFTLGQRLDINSENCNKYLQKFGTANNPDGTGATKLAFTGDIAFVSGSTDVKVNLRYSDVDLFNDATYFGLVQEDGKTAATTFILIQYKLLIYPQPASNNFQKQWRYYTFTIPGKELETRLVQTTNSNQFIYKGYYAISYYAAGTDQVQYTFYFEFSVTIDRATGASVDTAFKPLSQSSTIGCTPNAACVTKADTTLKWCTDLNCTAFATPDLHLNDQFVLQQVVTTLNMNYFLTGTEVWYTGNGLNKKATIVSVNNSVKGQVIIQLKAEIAWRSVTIKVTSTLSNTQTGARRLLAQTTYDAVSGETNELECIKAEGAEKCPDCDQECAAQGFASDSCSECSFSKIITFVFMALLLAFTI
ncbi:unnamed protein product (macronuclear) [Paramecium tetraurelia]|uniref:Uncharacterized protein n=1 Tax=Paramecium tetraurelia TaxID=5888 RepID=A0CCD6_PARTE|nr:uncharacterized protein GSPATT00037238001 [Paramecium tetraurelia]CAK68453.1 unnamed protein product [Paramecium tetraurelia]|eukprot:XP_001435850.1 hypothetical protein (macronuclear) [Paramecium tetraurelia strain d4-2]